MKGGGATIKGKILHIVLPLVFATVLFYAGVPCFAVQSDEDALER